MSTPGVDIQPCVGISTPGCRYTAACVVCSLTDLVTAAVVMSICGGPSLCPSSRSSSRVRPHRLSRTASLTKSAERHSSQFLQSGEAAQGTEAVCRSPDCLQTQTDATAATAGRSSSDAALVRAARPPAHYCSWSLLHHHSEHGHGSAGVDSIQRTVQAATSSTATIVSIQERHHGHI